MLVALHTLIAQGQGDSPGALALREEMEEPERHLSHEETIRLNALSGDLSILHDREIPDPTVTRNVPPQELPQRLVRAYEQEDWEEMIRLLRADVSTLLRPEEVAYLRSRAYEALDELVPAIAFMDEAVRRVPTNASFRALAMELLWKDDRHEEAFDRAKQYLDDPTTPARLVLMAGGIVCRHAQCDPPPHDIESVAPKTIDRIERALPHEQSPAMRVAGHGAIALLAARIGDRKKAESALQQAIKVEIGTDRQLTARGLLLAELELIRRGQLQSVQERSLARELAAVLVPDSYAVAA